MPGLDHLSARHYIGGERWGATLMTRRRSKANTFQLDAVYPGTLALQAQNVALGRFISAQVTKRW